jgi:hypothetical protein
VFDALTFIGFWHSLPAYLQLASMREAVLAPAIISVVLWNCGRHKALPEFTGVLFLAGIALTLVFSVFRDTGAEQSIHALPGYALLLVLMPPRLQPAWQQAFALSFANMLIADVWGAGAHCVTHDGYIPVTFYYGIGGAGLSDGLFVTAWILPLVLFLSSALRRKGLHRHSVPHLLTTLLRRAFSSNPSSPS